VLAASAAVPWAAFAQTTPGQINDPSTYRGSMANQAQEQQRLDQTYSAYAPKGGGRAPGRRA
jgi:hypothetical protein